MKTNIKTKPKNSSSSLTKKMPLSNNARKTIISPFNVGEMIAVKISALGSKNLGLAELSNGYTIAVPNVNLEDEVRVRIETIISKKTRYATAKIVDFVKKAKKTTLPRIGEVLDVTITKNGPKNSGLVRLFENFTLIVPKARAGDQLKVKVTRIKANYAFAKALGDKKISSHSRDTRSNEIKKSDARIVVGSKIDLIVPKLAKYYSNYFVVKFDKNENNNISSDEMSVSYLFIKMGLGVRLGDSVRIKVVKVGSNFAVAKILKVSPISLARKHTLAKTSIKKMVRTGMHFGEKTIRCHANMRKFVWIRKKDAPGAKYQNRPLIKRGRHLINLLRTRRCLTKALKQLSKYAAKGRTFLFVGTKKSASSLIARTAMLTKTSFFVNTRWLGGMLTNWKTILKSISQIRPILKEKQRIIKKILEKRQKIKIRLIKKVNLLRKRSQKLMTKGKILIAKIQNNKHRIVENSQKLVHKKTQLIQKNEILIQKYTQLSLKRKNVIRDNQQYKHQGNALIERKNHLLEQLRRDQRKLKQFTQLFSIGRQLLLLKKSSHEQGKRILIVPYAQFTKLLKLNENNSNSGKYAVPNPPKQVLNTIINSMKMRYDLDDDQIGALSLNKSKTENVSAETNDVFSPSAQEKENAILFSKLLNKFTRFLPFIRLYIETLILRIRNNQILLTNLHQNIRILRTKIDEYDDFIRKISSQLRYIKMKLFEERKNMLSLKTKLKKLASEQRLLKFLPKLRYLPTPKTKMYETIQILMKKLVDPKMSYPMDRIYDEKLKFTSKKIAAARKQKWQRLEKYFGGLTKMAKMNKKQISNNVAIIIGQQEEMNAVRECRKLGIKMFTLVDTNCNPRLADHIIPANDDSRNSIKFILGEMLTRIRLAQKLRKKILSRKIRKYSNKK